MKIPFTLVRLWHLARGLTTDRNRPDLAHLASIDDPERFVWSVLPHAARSFAASILLLPEPTARTSAVAYLYCRMLDTYEDLSDPAEREGNIKAFAVRMSTLDAPRLLPEGRARDDRDRSHLLLVERCALVDAVFLTLPPSDRARIVELVEEMADGMVWSSQRFAEQGGVLVNADQISRYCHSVIGGPVLFTLRTVHDAGLTPQQRIDALASSELIQLANITRDVERDLARGVGYHPSLRPHLGATHAPGATEEARRHLLAQALPNVSAYTRLASQLATKRISLARASAVLMLLFTDRHYASCTRRIGHTGWTEPASTMTMIVSSLLATVSRPWAFRVMRRVERDFLTASAALAAGKS